MKKDTDEKKPSLAMVAFWAVLCLGAIGTEIVTVLAFLDAQKIQSWPQTQGTIVRSELEEGSFGSHSTFRARIAYEYTVDGKEYTSDQVCTVDTESRNQFEAIGLLKKFPLGTEVPVYYNESKPDQSYLETDVGWMSYVLIIVPGILAIVLGVAVLGLLLIYFEPEEKKENLKSEE